MSDKVVVTCAVTGVLLNYTTGVMGRDQSKPLALLCAGRPELAALNAGSLNYLKTRSDQFHGTPACP